MNPTARVEYALRADDLLTEPQVRQIMEYYLAVRIRRYGRTYPAEGNTTSNSSSERGADRPLTRPAGPVRQMSSSSGPVGVGAGGIRPVVRATSREPGRY